MFFKITPTSTYLTTMIVIGCKKKTENPIELVTRPDIKASTSDVVHKWADVPTFEQ